MLRRDGRRSAYLRGAGALLLLLSCTLPASAQTPSATAFSSGIDPKEYETSPDGILLLKRVLGTHGFTAIEAAAQQNSREALFLVGIAKWQGVGTAIDLPGARALIRKAALSGFTRATYVYGNMLAQGVGGDKASEEAVSWWEQADQAGITAATFALAEYHRYNAPTPDLVKARGYYEKAAAKDMLDAKVSLADYLQFGLDGPQDIAGAKTAYEALADQGSGFARYRLAFLYRNGPLKDSAKALHYMKQAAADDYSGASYEAARMLTDGGEIPPDPETAGKILNAARVNDWKARALLAKLIITRRIKPIRGLDAEQLAMETQEHGFPEGYGSLVASFREGTNGYKRDLGRAAIMARIALANIQRLPKSAEGAWPMHAQGAAYTIALAIERKAVVPQPGEVEELKNRYGYPHTESGMSRLDVEIFCNGIPQAYQIYLWDTLTETSPVEEQFDWVEQSQGCVVPQETRLRFRRLYDTALATEHTFRALVSDYKQQANPKPLAPPIEF